MEFSDQSAISMLYRWRNGIDVRNVCVFQVKVILCSRNYLATGNCGNLGKFSMKMDTLRLDFCECLYFSSESDFV